MELLNINGMNDVTFTVGDIVTLFGLIASVVGVFIKMKIDKVKMAAEITALEKSIGDIKADNLGAKNSRHAIRKEFAEADDKIMDNFSKQNDKNGLEFKEINKQLSDINSGISRIEGLITKK